MFSTSLRQRRFGAARLGRSACLIGVALLGACKTSPLPPAPEAVEAYEENDYERAYRDATVEYSRTNGLRRDQAALMAGLSAHALGNHDDARRWLRPLTTHANRDISGRAAAALGLVEAEDENHHSAAALLSSAGRKLSGDAAARANFQAGESYAALGRLGAAKLHYRLAKATCTDTDLTLLIDERLGLEGFTVQVGAFSTRRNAERKVDEMRRRAAAMGLGDPRIVERAAARGKTLYLVHVGSYATEREAAAARARLGGEAVVARSQR